MRALLLLFLLAGCRSESEQAHDAPAQPAPIPETSAPPSGVPPPPAPSALPGLLPLKEAQVVAALGPGASCALSDGGQLLMVAVPGAAVINDGGRIVRLEASAKDRTALLKGGAFTAGGVSVEVDAAAVVERKGEVTVYDAGTYLRRGRRGLGTSHGARWSCGA